MQKSHPRITQLWYVGNSGTGGTSRGTCHHLDDLMVRGPPRGYYPEPTKSIKKSVLVVSPWNVLQAEAFFREYRFQIVTGSRYLGGFVRSKAAQDRWMGEKLEI